MAHSQPSVSTPVPALQSVVPALHVYEHLVPLQLAADALVRLHTFPHAAQFEVPVKLTQLPEHRLNPALQVKPLQLPAVQVAVAFGGAAHVTPQLPHVAGNARLASQPLVGFESQSAKPVLHTKPQLVPSHVAVALARDGHAVQLAPQLDTEVLSAHAPAHA